MLNQIYYKKNLRNGKKILTTYDDWHDDTSHNKYIR